MRLVDKVRIGWGYTAGPEGSQVVFANRDGQLVVDHWPTENPPTIAEIEAVVLPTPPPQPDWASFRFALLTSTHYVRITSAAPSAYVSLLTNVAFLVDAQPEKLIELAGVWNAIATIAQPTETEIAALNAIGTATHTPFALNETGLMV